MIGLAAVFLMIGLAAAIFSSANKEQPVTVAGAAQPDVVANMTAPANASQQQQQQQQQQQAATAEPLSELGVTPSAPANASAAPADGAP